MAHLELFTEDDWFKAVSQYLNSTSGKALMKKHAAHAFQEAEFKVPQKMVTQGCYDIISSWNAGSEFICDRLNEKMAKGKITRVTPKMLRDAISEYEQQTEKKK